MLMISVKLIFLWKEPSGTFHMAANWFINTDLYNFHIFVWYGA